MVTAPLSPHTVKGADHGIAHFLDVGEPWDIMGPMESLKAIQNGRKCVFNVFQMYFIRIEALEFGVFRQTHGLGIVKLPWMGMDRDL